MEQKLTLDEAILKRKSVRSYDTTSLSNEDLEQIINYAQNIEPLMPNLKTKVRLMEADEIKSIRSWRAPHYLAIYTSDDDNSFVNIGYVYEQLVIYLTSLGLGTCWVGSVSPKDYKECDGMKWVITLAFGREKNNQPWRNNLNEIKRKSLSSISKQLDNRLETVRIAPSTVNSQPWYFMHSDEKIMVYCKVQGLLKKWMANMNKIDIGIALSHLKISNEHFKFEIEKTPVTYKGYSYIGTITL